MIYGQGSGSFTVTIDGNTPHPSTITPPAGTELDATMWTSLPKTVHTITFTSTSESGKLFGVVCENGTSNNLGTQSGLKVSNLGVSGTTTANWLSPAQNLHLMPLYAAYGQKVDAAFVKLGVNDLTSESPALTTAQFKANMTALRSTRSTWKTSDFVILSSLQPTQPAGATTTAMWETYVNAMYDLADSLDVPLIDLHWIVYGPAPSAIANGLTNGDGTPHPSALGYYREAEVLARLLGA